MSSLLHKAHRTDSYPLLYRIADRFEWDKNLVACVLCELVCSFFLMYGGLSINAVEKIQNQTTHIEKFEYGIAVSWGLWILITNYIGFQLSGPHCNPAMSFLFYVLGAIPLKRFLLYVMAQLIGCYLGALFVFILYLDGISYFDGGIRQVHGPNATADIFATYPKEYLSVTGAFFDQFFTTAILSLIVLSITDDRNKVPKMAQPAIIGIALWGIISQYSHNCGAALNPARDFAPRLMTLTVGYGWGVFSFNNYKYFWIPILGPMLGAILGGYAYKTCLGDYLPSSIDHSIPTGPFHHPSIYQPSNLITKESFAASKASRSATISYSPNFLLPTVIKTGYDNHAGPTELHVPDIKTKSSSFHIVMDS
ncbi:Major intrinsic protein domain containing protein [Aphelenchoides besseyi]|nr:Major intrinsic protein domain containing protein [Aphelenchoides besseyi]KAI6195269.1 Major intrinsic protein domain containing protein [Aphelenchoides besseyi]